MLIDAASAAKAFALARTRSRLISSRRLGRPGRHFLSNVQHLLDVCPKVLRAYRTEDRGVPEWLLVEAAEDARRLKALKLDCSGARHYPRHDVVGEGCGRSG